MLDIKAVQAESLNKATAWLTQNLPAEEQAPVQVVAPPPQAQVVQPPVPAGVVPPKVETPAPVVPAKPGMADAIRRDREARAAAQAAQGEATKAKSEVEALRKENEQLKALGGANDPFDFLRNRKLTKEQQALWGQAFLYDLKPEVAPPEFRLDLYKAEVARKEAETKVQAEREAGERAQQVARGQIDQYANDILQHIQSNAGSCPESETWFTEDGPDGATQVNYRVYAQSLLATANNLVERAQRVGQQADLSPANIARVLEAEVSKRLARRDAKKAGSAKTDTQATGQPAQGGKPATEGTTTSAAGLRSGPPLTPDMSDDARKARAAAALFGTK